MLDLTNPKDNKILHDEYWGRLLTHAELELSNYDSFLEAWIELNKFEVKYAAKRKYGINGKMITTDFDTYLEKKHEYLKAAIDYYLTPNTDCIIELGSGWGRNILKLKNEQEYSNLHFISGELSDAGQQVTRLFSQKFNLGIDVIPFNWLKWDSLLKFLISKDFKEIIFYSYHSIEQIKNLNIKLLQDLLNLDINLKFIHIEPVGFQFENKRSPWSGVSSHYNINLKETLDELVSSNLIQIDNVEIGYFISNSNYTSLTSTLIQWQKKYQHL